MRPSLGTSPGVLARLSLLGEPDHVAARHYFPPESAAARAWFECVTTSGVASLRGELVGLRGQVNEFPHSHIPVSASSSRSGPRYLAARLLDQSVVRRVLLRRAGRPCSAEAAGRTRRQSNCTTAHLRRCVDPLNPSVNFVQHQRR